MSEMVERVAMAIYCDGTFPPYTVGANADKWAKTSETQRQFCRLQARAAIAAMREPTSDMLDVGEDTVVDMPEVSSRGMAGAVWDGMIQALLPDEALV